MVNRGQANYEAVSERLGNQAMQIISEKLGKGDLRALDRSELLTLFAGVIMILTYKVSVLLAHNILLLGSLILVEGTAQCRYAAAMSGDMTATSTTCLDLPDYFSLRRSSRWMSTRRSSSCTLRRVSTTDGSFENMLYHVVVVSVGIIARISN